MTEDFYVHRWFMHVFDEPGDQLETCVKALVKALKWRKDESVGGNTLTRICELSLYPLPSWGGSVFWTFINKTPGVEHINLEISIYAAIVYIIRMLTFSAITSDKLSPLLKEKGSLYIKNKDKDGWPLLVFAVKKHVKGMESVELMKHHFLYYLDRIDR